MIRNLLLLAFFTGIVWYAIWNSINPNKPDEEMLDELKLEHYTYGYDRWLCDMAKYIVQDQYPNAACEIIPTSTGAKVKAVKLTVWK